MDNSLKALSKSSNEIIVGNYMVLFGGKDLAGEHFTKKTKFDSPYTDIGTLYVDFEHGIDPDGLGIDENNLLGVVDWKTARVDDKGLFVERVLNRRMQYVDYISELIDAGVIGTSSEAVRGRVVKSRDGEIIEWPLMRDSITLTPMEPRMLGENLLKVAKSLHEFFPRSKSIASLLGKDIQVIKNIESFKNLSEAEIYLRDVAGFSRAKATAFVSRVKSLGNQSDSDELDEVKEALQSLKSKLK